MKSNGRFESIVLCKVTVFAELWYFSVFLTGHDQRPASGVRTFPNSPGSSRVGPGGRWKYHGSERVESRGLRTPRVWSDHQVTRPMKAHDTFEESRLKSHGLGRVEALEEGRSFEE